MRSQVILLMIFALLFTQAYAQSPTLEKVLANLEKRYERTDALTCQFTQVKSISQLVGKMDFNGKLIFRKPHFLYLELRGEENLNIYANGETIWLEDLDFAEVESFPVNTVKDSDRFSRLVPPLFLSGIDNLKSSFSIELLSKEGSRHVIQLIPLSPSPIANIRFAVDSRSRINWMKASYSNGDFTETRFRGWKKLPKISKHFFRYRKDGN